MSTFEMVDLFCGAGGTSTGAVEALVEAGYAPQLTAVNHWDRAVETHALNHPNQLHLCEGIDNLNPRKLFPNPNVSLLWASPECTGHSLANGDREVSDQSRATAWCVVRWAEALLPHTILVENVPQFLQWGPLTPGSKSGRGKPDPKRKGETFRAWLQALRSLGYTVDYKMHCADHYGDPTTRKRLFIQAQLGKRRIVWPERTHAPNGENGLKPWRVSRDFIDFDNVGTSIFSRKKPLSPNTLRRINQGLAAMGLGPLIIPQHAGGVARGVDQPVPTVTATARGVGLLQPFLISMENGGKVLRLDRPINTITGARGGAHGLVQPFLVELRGTSQSQVVASVRSIDEPLSAVTASGAHHMLINPVLVEYYGNGGAFGIDQPLRTVTTKQRFGIVMPRVVVDGSEYYLDLCYRMLQPSELAAAQGFRKDYRFAGNKTEQVKQIGNAVPRRLARALVWAAVTQNPRIPEALQEF